MHELHIDTLKQQNNILTLCEGDTIDLQIYFPSDFRSAKILRDMVDDICTHISVQALWKMRLILIADELHNNAIEYGSKFGDQNICILKIRKKCSEIEIFLEVIDTGTGVSHKTASQMQELQKMHTGKDFSKHSSIRGRGLFLIISDLVNKLSFRDIEGGGLGVSIELSVPKEIQETQKF